MNAEEIRKKAIIQAIANVELEGSPINAEFLKNYINNSKKQDTSNNKTKKLNISRKGRYIYGRRK